MTSPSNVCLWCTSTPLVPDTCISDHAAYICDLEIAGSQKLPNLDYTADMETARYTVTSMLPTKHGCYDLARYHGVA